MSRKPTSFDSLSPSHSHPFVRLAAQYQYRSNRSVDLTKFNCRAAKSRLLRLYSDEQRFSTFRPANGISLAIAVSHSSSVYSRIVTAVVEKTHRDRELSVAQKWQVVSFAHVGLAWPGERFPVRAAAANGPSSLGGDSPGPWRPSSRNSKALRGGWTA